MVRGDHLLDLLSQTKVEEGQVVSHGQRSASAVRGVLKAELPREEGDHNTAREATLSKKTREITSPPEPQMKV